MRPPLTRVLVLVAVLTACSNDPGFPWSDELTTTATEGASSYGLQAVSEVRAAVTTIDPFSNFAGCGTLSGVLAGDAPKDTDGDGIPDDATLTFVHDSTCGGGGTFYDGSIRMRDPGVDAGFNFTSDYTITYSESVKHRRQESRQIRFHGSSTTGAMSAREWDYHITSGVTTAEESGYSANFTLTAADGTTLDPGEFGAGTLTLTGEIDHKDAVPPTADPWRFTLSTPNPLVIDPGCGLDGPTTSGDLYGRLNGGTSVTFTRSWTACGAETITTEGTTP